jgi:competence protein ComEA
MFLGLGLLQLYGPNCAELVFETAANVECSGDLTAIKVDVDGEVAKPGLYSLKPDARVQDALIAAGGLTPNANRRAINLALKVADGQKIYVPAVGEVSAVQSTVLSAQSELISINQASESELDKLPGVGPVTAQKIIDFRPYSSIEELVSKKAVGEKVFEKIRDLITL